MEVGRLKGQGRENEEKGKGKGRKRKGKGKGKGKERESDGNYCSFGSFRNSFEISKQPNKPKEVKYRNRTETDSVSVCFGSNRKKRNLFRRTP